MSFGKSLELFFVNGKPDEILTARVFNWTGHVLKTPRTQIKEALDRPEADYSGVYLLLGTTDGQPLTYVGESECISSRIKSHDLKKDWWNDAVLITTTANELNKAHVRYLESRLIALATAAKVTKLDNSTTPVASKLSEAATANMEEFLDVLKLVLPAIGVDAFVNKMVTLPKATGSETPETPLFLLENKKHRIISHARLLDGNFVVLKSSQARQAWEGKAQVIGGYQILHKKLVEDGVIDTSQSPAIFTSDYAFDSPSAAATVCQGRTANGRLDWKVEESGLTYSAWEESLLKKAQP